MNKKKHEIYESVTKSLVKQLEDMNLPRDQRLRAKNLTLLFRDSFKLETVKHATFYIDAKYDYKFFPYDSYGFCRASSFSFVALMNNPDWQLMYIDDIWAYGPHFFVMHMPSRKPFDLTFDQYLYDGIEIPYYLGRPAKIDKDGKNVITRFLHAAEFDFSLALKNLNRD